MAITPTAGAVSLANTLEIVEQPTLTYYVDPDTKRIRGTADGLTDVYKRQAYDYEQPNHKPARRGTDRSPVPDISDGQSSH